MEVCKVMPYCFGVAAARWKIVGIDERETPPAVCGLAKSEYHSRQLEVSKCVTIDLGMLFSRFKILDGQEKFLGVADISAG